MSHELSTHDNDSLRYLEANAVDCPAGKLDGFSLLSQDEEALGAIDGVLIDPARRQIRYFVVEAPRLLSRRRYLVSADTPAVMVPEDHALRVEVPSDRIPRERFDSRSVPRFSDDDLLTALFSSPAA
jgi:hypothetical protein